MANSQDRPPPAADAAWSTRVTEALASISDAVYFLDAEDRFTLGQSRDGAVARPSGGAPGGPDGVGNLPGPTGHRA
jgi:hypothetical protein